jgi:hypothetical protein
VVPLGLFSTYLLHFSYELSAVLHGCWAYIEMNDTVPALGLSHSIVGETDTLMVSQTIF